MRKEEHPYIHYVARTSRNRMSTTWDLYCCLLPQCEPLRTCCSGFPIITKWPFDQDVMVVPGATFTKRTFIATGGYCCNLLVGVALKVRFITNGMCAKSNTQIYVARTSNNRVITSGDPYCCLLPQRETLRTCRPCLLIATQETYFLVFRMPDT